jgi:hypothetical protein
MLSFLLSASGFILWTFLIIMTYYSKSFSGVDHMESASEYWGYLITIFILYALYKWGSLAFGYKKLTFWFFSLLWVVLLHILILSIVYSGFPEVRQSPFMQWAWASGLTLFMHIYKLLLYPLALICIVRSVGFSFASLLHRHWRDIDIRLRLGAEISLGFVFFTLGLLILWSLWLYTLSGLFILLGILLVLWYTWHRETYRDITQRSIELENHNLSGWLVEKLNLKLLSIEFGFFFLTFLLAISLINIIRPMPIGWDDLW